MNKYDIECIGYKLQFTGEKMHYYKLLLDGNECLIVDASMRKLLNMRWSEKNDWEDADLSDEILDEVIIDIPLNDKILEEDEEKTFFTKYDNIEEVEEEIRHTGNTYTGDEINEILDVLNEFDYIYDEKKFKVITENVSEYSNEEYIIQDLFKELVGYKVKFKTDGDHKNDGQMVEYTFTFVSPTKKKTTFSTEMCLMVGWNYHGDLTIK